MTIANLNGKPLVLQRPNPIVAQVSEFWEEGRGHFTNWNNFAPSYIQEQPSEPLPPIPQFKEDDDRENSRMPEFVDVGTEEDDDDWLYSGSPETINKAMGSNEIKDGPRTIAGGYDPYDPKSDPLHFSKIKDVENGDS